VYDAIDASETISWKDASTLDEIIAVSKSLLPYVMATKSKSGLTQDQVTQSANVERRMSADLGKTVNDTSAREMVGKSGVKPQTGLSTNSPVFIGYVMSDEIQIAASNTGYASPINIRVIQAISAIQQLQDLSVVQRQTQIMDIAKSNGMSVQDLFEVLGIDTTGLSDKETAALVKRQLKDKQLNVVMERFTYAWGKFIAHLQSNSPGDANRFLTLREVFETTVRNKNWTKYDNTACVVELMRISEKYGNAYTIPQLMTMINPLMSDDDREKLIKIADQFKTVAGMLNKEENQDTLKYLQAWFATSAYAGMSQDERVTAIRQFILGAINVGNIDDALGAQRANASALTQKKDISKAKDEDLKTILVTALMEAQVSDSETTADEILKVMKGKTIAKLEDIDEILKTVPAAQREDVRT